MKKKYLFLFNIISLIWLELIFGIVIFNNFINLSSLTILLFIIPCSILNTVLLSLFSRKTNFIIGCILYSILGLVFSLQLVFKRVFNTFFQISLLSLSDQLLSFGLETIKAILTNLHFILLLFLPLILFIILRKKLNIEKTNKKLSLISTGIFLITLGFFFLYPTLLGKENTTYKVIYKLHNNAQSLEQTGVLNTTLLDIVKTCSKFEEEIILLKPTDQENNNLNGSPNEEIEEIIYEKNIEEINFSLGNNESLNNYMLNDEGTYKNEYTGIFEGKNLIYITAESFHTIGVSEELTPTLYHLINDGFVFENFYVPNNLSTIGGEFQSLTGLYADNSILNTWRSGKNYFPYGLATKFKQAGYQTYAYHNNSYAFQDRNKYLSSQGFTNFKGCYNGMEKLINCKRWPQSDVDMIDKTTSDYLNSNEPFMAYYMTVSGHFEYTYNGNSIASKNKNLVDHLNYSQKVKGYIATQIELDKALELLIERLKEKGILEDTVIVLLADHYPYGLTEKEIAEVSTYDRDGIVELNHNSLIIWNSEIEKTKVDKVGMSIDVIPTVYNLFNISYDSRLLMGKDIFSTTEGIAIMKDRSWVTNKGTYFSSTNTFVPKNEPVSDEYINYINNIVANRLNVSKMIVSNNYYNSLLNK
ncbi:MAG: LTA synthase family protein [Firmicutes bacterium]|nr:LTA synthase family protein [Bacillota bacterium]